MTCPDPLSRPSANLLLSNSFMLRQSHSHHSSCNAGPVITPAVVNATPAATSIASSSSSGSSEDQTLGSSSREDLEKMVKETEARLRMLQDILAKDGNKNNDDDDANDGDIDSEADHANKN